MGVALSAIAAPAAVVLTTAAVISAYTAVQTDSLCQEGTRVMVSGFKGGKNDGCTFDGHICDKPGRVMGAGGKGVCKVSLDIDFDKTKVWPVNHDRLSPEDPLVVGQRLCFRTWDTRHFPDLQLPFRQGDGPCLFPAGSSETRQHTRAAFGGGHHVMKHRKDAMAAQQDTVHCGTILYTLLPPRDTAHAKPKAFVLRDAPWPKMGATAAAISFHIERPHGSTEKVDLLDSIVRAAGSPPAITPSRDQYPLSWWPGFDDNAACVPIMPPPPTDYFTHEHWKQTISKATSGQASFGSPEVRGCTHSI